MMQGCPSVDPEWAKVKAGWDAGFSIQERLWMNNLSILCESTGDNQTQPH